VTTTRAMLTLTAEDLMTHMVTTIPQEMPLQAAARLLAREAITGAPVVNAVGRCVGVLSATDFLRWADAGARPEAARAPVRCICSDWQVVDPEALPKDEVRLFMSTDLVTADPTTSITDLARRMLDAHIHRIIVVDAQHRPIGVVSTTDILAAVAYARSEPCEQAAHPF